MMLSNQCLKKCSSKIRPAFGTEENSYQPCFEMNGRPGNKYLIKLINVLL